MDWWAPAVVGVPVYAVCRRAGGWRPVGPGLPAGGARACTADDPAEMPLAAAEEPYYHEHLKPLVDGKQIVYFGEADFDAKVRLFGGARALLYPIQAREPFGLVLPEAMACGTPVAALDRGAVREVVDDGITGVVFDNLEQMIDGLPRVFALDRTRIRRQAVARFGVERMAGEYAAVYQRVVEAHRARSSR